MSYSSGYSLSVRCAGCQASLSQGHGFESQNEHRQRENGLRASRRDEQARPEEYDRAGWRLLSSDGRGAILLFVLLCVTPIRSVSTILPLYKIADLINRIYILQ